MDPRFVRQPLRRCICAVRPERAWWRASRQVIASLRSTRALTGRPAVRRDAGSLKLGTRAHAGSPSTCGRAGRQSVGSVDVADPIGGGPPQAMRASPKINHKLDRCTDSTPVLVAAMRCGRLRTVDIRKSTSLGDLPDRSELFHTTFRSRARRHIARVAKAKCPGSNLANSGDVLPDVVDDREVYVAQDPIPRLDYRGARRFAGLLAA